MKNEITIDGVVYAPKNETPLSDRVLVRCKNAGVHVGTLHLRENGLLVLKNANRIWQWSGAFTLSEVAMKGVNRSNSRIACMVPEITLTDQCGEVCEVIRVTEGVDLSCTEDE